jgi:hypothetical protein
MRSEGTAAPNPVERVQTVVRMEKRLIKVCKALAELYDLPLGEFLEDPCGMPSPAARRSQTSLWPRPPS